MKKLIFGLMAFMLLFFVVSCDNGTTNNNSDVSTETDPYEELEKSLTVKLSSIDEVEFSDGEWEYYFERYEEEIGAGFSTSEYKGIMTVDNGLVTLEYNYEKTIIQCFNEETYLHIKEAYVDREGFSLDDEKKIIYFPENIQESIIDCDYEEFIFDYLHLYDFFREDCKEENYTTYLAKTNSKKDTFFYEVKKEVPFMEMVFGEKYIFKKIK